MQIPEPELGLVSYTNLGSVYFKQEKTLLEFRKNEKKYIIFSLTCDETAVSVVTMKKLRKLGLKSAVLILLEKGAPYSTSSLPRENFRHIHIFF